MELRAQKLNFFVIENWTPIYLFSGPYAPSEVIDQVKKIFLVLSTRKLKFLKLSDVPTENKSLFIFKYQDTCISPKMDPTLQSFISTKAKAYFFGVNVMFRPP